MDKDRDKMIKCVVWDLDNTLWDGILLEDKCVKPRVNIKSIIDTLDQRGILQSVASKNDHNSAMEQLEKFGLTDFFLYPQINWNSKAHSIRTIASLLNIHTDSMAIVDDSPFELDEVKYELPEVSCIPADMIPELLRIPELNLGSVTKDGCRRRKMVHNELRRKIDEEEFKGPKEAFLKSLKMKLTLFKPGKGDLERAAELTQRTHQLNTTGYAYSVEELDEFRRSADHILLMARLTDRYGDYGQIGLMLIEKNEHHWNIRLLLMSCRVMTRGVGSVLLSHIINLARENGKELKAEYIPNDRNRMMRITYQFMNFQEIESVNGKVMFRHNPCSKYSFPDYMEVKVNKTANH